MSLQHMRWSDRRCWHVIEILHKTAATPVATIVAGMAAHVMSLDLSTSDSFWNLVTGVCFDSATTVVVRST